MLTYHPMGTRGYKNLQKWNLGIAHGTYELLENGMILMNDQEPIMPEYIYQWKKDALQTPRPPFDTLIDLFDRVNKKENYWHTDGSDQDKWEQGKNNFVSNVDHFNQITTDKSFVGKVLFPGIVKPIIVHSELNSREVEELNDEFIPVYVFWHGLVSRDWYRHWRHNIDCKPNIDRANNQQRFLLYARAWTGSRKYRLDFVEQIIKNNLHTSFKYNFFELDDGEYYKQHCDTDISEYFTPAEEQEVNLQFHMQILKGHIADNERPSAEQNESVSSNSSAYIDVRDYRSTAIQIVAETLFDTEKIHLTEKTFQPIVAGQPFLTLSAPGTLEVLRYYGFHTFEHVWDESYDSIKDPQKRMQAVLEQIKKLNSLSKEEFKQVYEKCLAVCEHNRQHFFSDRFEQQMLTEYDHNFKRAFEKQKEYAKENPGGSRFWIANEICFNCYNTEFFYKQDQNYLKYMLQQARNYNEDQYQAILKQYWWAEKLANMV